MQPQFISKETIKPSNSTPQHLRTLNLSLLDHFSPLVFVRIGFFYANNTEDDNSVPPLEPNKLKKLSPKPCLTIIHLPGGLQQKALSSAAIKALNFFETRVNCKLADILKKPQIETISHLFPVSSDESLNGAEIGCLLLIQFTTFDCGGTAIGTCFSHKVADACSIATFMNDWASIARDPSAVISPQFTGTSLFPLNDQKAISSKMMSADANCSTRRLVFYATKIDHLKARAQKGSSEAIQATRFEVISAIICKSITSAFRSLNLPEPGVLNVIVNLRKRMEPKLSNHHVGNFALHNLIEVAENERDLHGLVCLLKAGMAKFGENFTGKHTQYELSSKICESYDELGKLPRSNHGEMLLFSSWCTFPFYEVDFGSGKPAWVSSLPSPTKNCIFLCDSRKGDAVEAWVSLEDRVMNLFECDEELLAFASANPSPLEIEEDVNC